MQQDKQHLLVDLVEFGENRKKWEKIRKNEFETEWNVFMSVAVL